jgi:hypothetical protein
MGGHYVIIKNHVPMLIIKCKVKSKTLKIYINAHIYMHLYFIYKQNSSV